MKNHIGDLLSLIIIVCALFFLCKTLIESERAPANIEIGTLPVSAEVDLAENPIDIVDFGEWRISHLGHIESFEDDTVLVLYKDGRRDYIDRLLYEQKVFNK